MLEEIEQYAKEYMVPIMDKEGIEFLTNFIKENSIKSILEIGSAIGYSAIKIALVDKNIKVVTVERDIERYNEAIKNIKNLNLETQITIYNQDAFDFETDEQFDMLFIDAAKAQNKTMFLKFENNIKKYIVTDNLKFHGLVNSEEEIKSRNVRALVRKINDYVEFLKQNNNYKTTFYNIGDGISISER